MVIHLSVNCTKSNCIYGNITRSKLFSKGLGIAVNGTFSSRICDFTGCTTQQEHLDAIETFEDEMNKPKEEETVTAEERIAAALEAQVMMSLPDEESGVK